jgi:5'-3' exonuclease
MKNSKRILIVDQLNLFFRNYIVNPSLSVNGSPIGALKGCFQSLQKIVRESKPDMIIICWDGAGGSSKRKLLKKDYKAGRKPIRLNRAIRNLSSQEEMENKIWQQTRLIEYYNQIPVVQFMFDGIEADDIIAYICKLPSFQSDEKLIVSSDKDFYQLLDNKTILNRPVQKQIMSKKSILDEFDIHPNNFAMARAMAGDKSDNISGVGGIGLKTAAKRFPFLKKEEAATFNDMFDFCRQQLKENKVKAYSDLLDKQEILKRNYKMMQLYSPLLTVDSKKNIRETLENPDNTFNKTELIKMMIKDGFGEINFIELFQHFNKICVDNS